MKNDVISNLALGIIGRSASAASARMPIVYAGETSLFTFYFEDLLDAYGSSLENVDKSAAQITVKVGVRGSAPLLTVNNGAFTNIPRGISLQQGFGGHRCVFKFDKTPVDGFFNITMAGSTVLPAGKTIPDGSPIPIVYGAHSIFRDGTSGKLHATADESDIEDAITAMFNEIVEGMGGRFSKSGWLDSASAANFLSNNGANGGKPGTPTVGSDPNAGYMGPGSIELVEEAWGGVAVPRGLVAPVVRAQQVKDGTFIVHCFIPDIELDQAYVLGRNGWVTHSEATGYMFDGNGLPSAGATDTPQKYVGPKTYEAVTVQRKGAITITNLQVNQDGDEPLLSAAGKQGTLPFTDAAFSALFGNKNEVKLWMEIMLDDGVNQTAVDGNILMKKRMA